MPLVYFALSLLGLLTWRSACVPKRLMTRDEYLTYLSALAKDNPPLSAAEFRGLSGKFFDAGFLHEADILMRRARIRDLPPAQQAALTEAAQRGMSSSDPVFVRSLANSFEAEAYFGVAAALRDYANTLDVAATISQTQALRAAQQERQAAIQSATAAEMAHVTAGATAPRRQTPTEEATAKVMQAAVSTLSGVAASAGVPAPTASAVHQAAEAAGISPATTAQVEQIVEVGANGAKSVLGSIFGTPSPTAQQ